MASTTATDGGSSGRTSSTVPWTPHGDLVPVGRLGQGGQHPRGRVEVRWHVEGAREHRRCGDAVEPEEPHLAARRVRAGHVPARGVRDDAVGVQGAVTATAVAVDVADGDRRAVPGSLREEQQHVGLRGGGRARPGRGGEGDGLRERPQPGRQRSGQHAAQLGRGALGGHGGRRRRLGPAEREQAQQHGEGFLVGEHQRRHAVARGEPVAAVAAAHRADRDVQVDEVGHVAAHGALVDGEAFSQLGDRAGAARLQDLQQGQHPGGGTGHTA